jgi:hypothetical protein
VSSFDLFNTRHELITVLAGDFYDRRRFLSPLRRLQLAYGCLLLREAASPGAATCKANGTATNNLFLGAVPN